MLEAMIRRVTLEAERRAGDRAQAMARQAQDELPDGVRAESVTDGVRLVGKRLRARLVTDAALREFLARLR